MPDIEQAILDDSFESVVQFRVVDGVPYLTSTSMTIAETREVHSFVFRSIARVPDVADVEVETTTYEYPGLELFLRPIVSALIWGVAIPSVIAFIAIIALVPSSDTKSTRIDF
jgi:hypothetical protein